VASDTGSSSTSKDEGLSTGAKAGISIAVIAIIAGIGALVFYLLRRRQSEARGKISELGEGDAGFRNKYDYFEHGTSKNPVYELGEPEPAELMGELREKERQRRLVDERVAAGYDGAYRGH
jgi:hypothetical protein